MTNTIDQPGTATGRYPTSAVLAAMTGGAPASTSELDDIIGRIADPDLTDADVKALQVRVFDMTMSLSSQLAGRAEALKTERVAREIAAAQHPAWCDMLGKGVCDRSDHMSNQSIIPATGSGWTLVDDAGAMFPFVDVYTETRRGTEASVTVGVGRPNEPWREVRLSAARIRDFAACLWSAVELALKGDSALLDEDSDSLHTSWCDDLAGHDGFGCFSESHSVLADRPLFDDLTDSAVGASAHLVGGENGLYTVQVSVNQTDSDFAEVDLTVHEAAKLYSALDEHARQIEQG